MIILGVDPASLKNTGFSVVETNYNNHKIIRKGTIICNNDNEKHHLLQIYEYFIDIINEYNIDMLATERSMGFGKSFVRNQVTESTAIIKLVALQNNIKIVDISPKHWKKVLTGNGNATKKEGIEKVLEYFDIKKEILCSEHEADSLALIACFIEDNRNILQGE